MPEAAELWALLSPQGKPLRVSLLEAQPLPARSLPLPGVLSTLSCLAPSPSLENLSPCFLESALFLRRPRAVSTQGLEILGWTCQRPRPGPLPLPQTPAWPGFLSSEAVLAGLGGIRQQFPPNSQADCRHLCCQQNCKKCNSCC